MKLFNSNIKISIPPDTRERILKAASAVGRFIKKAAISIGRASKKAFFATCRFTKKAFFATCRFTKKTFFIFCRGTKITVLAICRVTKRLTIKAVVTASPYVKAFLLNLNNFLYIVGIQSVRVFKRFHKRLMRFLAPAGRLCRRAYQATIGRYLRSLHKNVMRELALIKEGKAEARERIHNAKGRSCFSRVKESASAVGGVVALHHKIFATVLNVAAPIAAVFLLVMTVNHWNSLNFGLVLNYDGKEIATIENERVFEQATEMVNQRMVHDVSRSTEGATVDITPTFMLSVVDAGFYAPASAVCNKIIQQSNDIIEEATGLYVDGSLMGAVKSGADLTYILQNILNGVKSDDKNADASFVQNVETVTGLFPTASLVSSDNMKKELTSTSQNAITYTVKDGDTLTSIAQAHKMTLDELSALNAGIAEMMHPGDLVNIQVAVPKLGVQLTKTEVSQVVLPFKTITEKDDKQYTDYTKVKTEGVNGLQERTDKVIYINGAETKRENIKTVTLTEPVSKVVVTGSKKRPTYSGSGVSSGNLMWPTPSLHTITSYYTWRWGSFHTGLDIAGGNAYGKPIVAADGGKVVASGWDGSYGNRVIIDHGNGLKTLYAHASKLLVSVGTKVSKGQTIALVGSTGNSTGPHCHFSVYKNGQLQNPLNYLN